MSDVRHVTVGVESIEPVFRTFEILRDHDLAPWSYRYLLIMAARKYWPRPITDLCDSEIEESLREFDPMLILPDLHTDDSVIKLLMRTCGCYMRIQDKEIRNGGSRNQRKNRIRC